ncbi:threonine synthase [Flavobacteriaceae bacterium R38]|nr:threonine synthase [Flavobacteriaceae bacterium R38]
MNYYSLNNKSPKASFKEALINGLAPDRGLYFPESIESLGQDFIKKIDQLSHQEIAFEAIKQFVGNEIPENSLKEIIEKTLSFNFPLEQIEDNIYSLELFHGPTMAFKDVGAQFMAQCMGYFNRQSKTSNVTVLVATSGDTGGAVANGFLGVEGIDVVILYPSGKVSDIQEKQLTTLGNNIQAVEVNGTFDDCQEMVKTAFLDTELNSKKLTSANSINIARWIPQMFYFFFAYKALKDKSKEITFSVPSGNFGNICAGIMAYKLGLPVKHFVAATNINDTIHQFLETGIYAPKTAQQTISNAMDVGDPSNFIRIQQLMNNDIHKLKSIFSSYSFTDQQTKEGMKKLYKNASYVSDPHGAIGYLGLKKYLKNKSLHNTNGIFLETAHPCKFLDTVENTIKTKVEIPLQIKSILEKEKNSIKINDYSEFKSFLLKS